MVWGRRPAGAVKSPISIVSASDDNYAMPLAVTVRSAIDRLAPDQPLNVYILDGGLSWHSKRRLLKSWKAPLVNVQWLSPPIAKIAELMKSRQPAERT